MREFLKGYYALGLVLGVGATVLAFVWLVGVDYCPKAPCPSGSHWGRLGALFLEEDGSLLPPISEGQLGRSDFLSFQGLRVQRTIADASIASVWLSACATFFSAVAALLLIKTFRETRNSTLAAQKSAKVSEQTLMLMQDAHVREIRAYVNVSKVRLEYGEESGVVNVKVFIRNSGLTPARGMRLHVQSVRSCTPKNASFPLEIGKDGSQTVLSKGEDFLVHLQLDILNSKMGFTVGVLIHYKDIFGNKRKTLYKGFCSAQDIKNRKFNLEICPKHNRST